MISCNVVGFNGDIIDDSSYCLVTLDDYEPVAVRFVG